MPLPSSPDASSHNCFVYFYCMYLLILFIYFYNTIISGLGLRSLSLHSPAAFIASVCSAGYGSHSTSHLSQAIDMFNCLVASSDVISVENLLSSCSVHQKALSEKLDDRQFNLLLNCSSVADRARLLSVSSHFAASWLSVIPSEGLGLHLTAPIF